MLRLPLLGKAPKVELNEIKGPSNVGNKRVEQS